jgi:hypothetical protein
MKRLTSLLVLAPCLVIFQLGFAARAEDGKRTASKKHGEAVHLLETWIESLILPSSTIRSLSTQRGSATRMLRGG